MGITVPGTTRAPSGMALVALCLLAGGNPIMADEFRPELCAFELASDQLVAGESLPATYEFVNTGGACASEQTVFVHIRPAAMRPADVPPAAGGDFKPALPSYAWPTGAVVRETGRPLGVPADFPPGRYDIYVGMWDPCGGDRTEFGNPDIAAPGRRYLVATVDVLAPGSTAAGEPIRNRWHETTGLPTAWEAMRSSEPPSSVTLPGEGVGVVLDATLPRAVRHEFADGAKLEPGYRGWPTRAIVRRDSDATYRAVVLTPQDCRLDVMGSQARYEMTVRDAGEVAARFSVTFSLQGRSLRVTVGDVEELAGHELMDVYLPPLVAAHGEDGALAVPNQGGRLVPVAGESEGQATVRMDWMVGDLCAVALQKGAAAAIRTRNWDNQLRAWTGGGAGQLDPRFALRAEAYGDAARIRLATETGYEVGLIQDEDGDGEVSWVDAARWLRHDLAGTPSPIYQDALVYKIFCDTPGPQVVTTYDQALDIIRTAHGLAPWLKQVVYLVGWQFEGHDTGYPATDVFNPRPGGLEGLRRACEEARRYNAVLSYHDNFDDAYVTSPEWDASVIARDNHGQLQVGGVWAGGQSYILAFGKYARRYGLERVRRTLAQMPVRESYHIDVLTAVPVRQDFDPDEPESTQTSLEGKFAMIREFNRLGVDVTSEGFTAPFVGVVGHSWHFWHRPDRFFAGEREIPLLAFIYHGGPTCWGNGAQTRYYAQDSALQGAGFSTDWMAGVNPHDMAWSIYMVNVPWAALRERRMESYHEEGPVAQITYGPDSYVRVNRETGEWRVVVDGVTLVDNDLVTVRRPGLLAVFLPRDGEATVELPPDLQGKALRARNAVSGETVDLAGRVGEGTVTLALKASEPVLVEAR